VPGHHVERQVFPASRRADGKRMPFRAATSSLTPHHQRGFSLRDDRAGFGEKILNSVTAGLRRVEPRALDHRLGVLLLGVINPVGVLEAAEPADGPQSARRDHCVIMNAGQLLPRSGRCRVGSSAGDVASSGRGECDLVGQGRSEDATPR